VKKIGGGVAQVFREILRFLFAPGGHSFMTSGVELELFDGTRVRIWARLEMVLQDGGAHKHVWMLKGDGGLRGCVECRNMLFSDNDVVDENGETMLTCNMHLRSEMDFAVDQDVIGTVHRLSVVAANRPGELKLRETAVGFNHSKFNLLLEPALNGIIKPVSNMAHDWMHTMVVHGVWNTIMFLLLMALQPHAQVVQGLQLYIAMWTLPLRLGVGVAERLADAFSKQRWEASSTAKYLKCTASDAISMYGIIVCYIQSVFLRAGVCVLECTAYLLLCDVLDLLVVMPRGIVTYQQLEEAIDKFLKACIDAGWRDNMHPKFHWCIHLARELRIFGMLLTCWVHERKHRMVKRYTNNQRNTKTYETSILSEITCQHFHNLRDRNVFDLTTGLQDPQCKCSPLLKTLLGNCLNISIDVDCVTSKTARVSKFEVVHQMDVVVFHNVNHLCLAQIKFLVAVDDTPFAVIDHWPLESKNVQQGTASVYTNRDMLKFVHLDSILTACTWRRRGNLAQIIVPSIYRDGVA